MSQINHLYYNVYPFEFLKVILRGDNYYHYHPRATARNNFKTKCYDCIGFHSVFSITIIELFSYVYQRTDVFE